MTALIEQSRDNGKAKSVRSHAKSNGSRVSGTSESTELARQRAKAEAAKARLTFERRELEMKKEKARIEEEHLKAKANVERKKTEMDADLELLGKERDAVVAQAEYEAFRDELRDDHSEDRVKVLNVQQIDSTEQIRQYLNVHVDSRVSHPEISDNVHEPTVRKVTISSPQAYRGANFAEKSMLNPNTPPFVPDQTSGVQDIAKFLVKKDLLIQRLTSFNDSPEMFSAWKCSFQSIAKEMCLTPAEEFDLLIKWLGPESKKYAVSLRSANANNLARGLERLWERLYERYGSPEMVESALKKKLERFPKLGNRDNKKLFELSDILAEIESCMEDPKYSLLLSYYNASSGVLPIVSKLPYHLQNKWTNRATKYKKMCSVAFPPFTEFCEFIREMSSMLNDPGFNMVVESRDTTSSRSGNSRTFPVNVRKTDVKQESVVKQRSVDEKFPGKCPIHNSNHSLNMCRVFRNKTLADRKCFLREHQICYRCCESDSHIFRNCTAFIKCDICRSDRHPTALHAGGETSENAAPLKNYGRERQSCQNESNATPQTKMKETVATKCTSVCGPEFYGRSCAKIVPVIVHPGSEKKKGKKMYAILDDQSNRTLARPEFFDMMGVSPEMSTQYTLMSCAGTYQTQGRHLQGYTVSAMDESFSLTLHDVLECSEIPNARSEIATPEVVQFHRHLQDIAIPDLDSQADILLLIGRDIPEAHHVLEQRVGPRNSPFAQRLGFGWVIIGDVCRGKAHKPDRVNVLKTRVLEDGRPTIFPQCDYRFVVKHLREGPPNLGEDVFLQTKHDNKPGLSIEDKHFLEIMDAEFKKDIDGHWSAPLPFRESRTRLPNNKPQALRRAYILDAGLKKNEEKRRHMTEFMEKIFQNGHAEIAPRLKDREECWYLPVFGVYHKKKKGQIRVVFDSSAKFEGVSLNDVLLSGPDLTNNLVGILMRFREKPIAVTGDIQQMFYQFRVHEKDRNFLRFMWYRDNDTTKDLVEYRMCVHVFGNSPSPAVASYGLRKIAQAAVPSVGDDVKNFIDENFYVDDGLASLPSTEEAVSLMKRTQTALYTEGGLRLHKIASNDKDVLSAFPEEDLEKGLKTLDLTQDELPIQRSLGLSWDLENDCFVFRVAEQKPGAYTKRVVLSAVNSLYDPLGFIAPVTIGGKILLREITAEVDDWDEPLPAEMRDKWDTWVRSLQSLTDVKIPRTYCPTKAEDQTKRELHVFSDASEKAIAAVAFLRVIDKKGQIHVGFVHGKSKVAPKHGHTIPRLELCAAVLAVEIAETVSEELSLQPDDIKFYTDSKVVLGYLQNKTRRFYIYVENRVSRILHFSTSDQWCYIATDQNPADHGTRYVSPSSLHDCSWLSGCSALRELSSSDIVKQQFTLVSPDEDSEIRPEVKTYKTVVADRTVLGTDRFTRFSDWERLIKAVSLLMHVADTFKSKEKNEAPCRGWHNCKNFKNVQLQTRAKDFIIKQYQQEAFGKEIQCLAEGIPLKRDSSILTLSPFLDENGILRVGGRLKNADLPEKEKHPILIPRQCHLATLLVRYYHNTVCHQGRHFTEGAVRAAGFWIIGGKRLINFLIHKCVKCRRLRGKLGHQKMSDLPSDRVTPCPPFSFVGVDVFGPWSVVTRRTRGGVASAKRWAVLFSCQTTRAIHLELIEEMSSSSFINALRRFYAIRGKVQEFRSDRGTNFVGATDDLKIDAINVEDGPVEDLLYKSGTVWRFNTPHSSHMGGSWERLIGVSRRVLDAVLMEGQNLKLTHEVLSTFLAEVMSIVNSRPLVPVSMDAEDPLVLSPSVLLTQKTGSVPESFDHINIKDAYRAQWKHVQYMSETFWRRWRREYLHLLQSRQKWSTETVSLKEDDVILLKDKTVSRSEWPLGLVIRVFPGDDQLVRKVQLRIIVEGKPVNYVRPITEIVKLL